MEKQLIINDISTIYSISDNGTIKNIKTGKTLKISKRGTVQLSVNQKSKVYTVGRLVAETFLPKPTNKDLVIHVDGNLENNNIENLKWVSNQENVKLVWEKRRINGTTGAGVKRETKTKQEDIVGIIDQSLLKEDEKQIFIENEPTPYIINIKGEVKNSKTGNILKGSILNGYRYFALRWQGKQKNKSAHQLVALMFIPNPNNYSIVDHIDGDRLNNQIDNLRWASASENSKNIHPEKTPLSKEYPPVIFSEKELNTEIWKECRGYEVSNLGRIKGKRGGLLKGYKRTDGYIKYGENELGHLLVWEAFNGVKNPNLVINHKDGNKSNNRLSNLEEITQTENLQKASTETNAWNFSRVGEYTQSGELLRIFANATQAANAIGILSSSLRNSIRKDSICYNGLKYKYLDK